MHANTIVGKALSSVIIVHMIKKIALVFLLSLCVKAWALQTPSGSETIKESVNVDSIMRKAQKRINYEYLKKRHKENCYYLRLSQADTTEMAERCTMEAIIKAGSCINLHDIEVLININTFSVQKETGEKDEKGNPIYETYSGLSITGVTNNVFEYLARHTDVEWGLSSNKDDKNNCLLSTNHDGSTVRLDENVLRPGDDTFFHSHPNGNLDPCDSDMATFYSLLKDTNYNYKRMAIYSPSLYS